MSDLKVFTKNIEEKAMEQINTLIAQPVFSELLDEKRAR